MSTTEQHPFTGAFDDLEKWGADHAVVRLFSDTEGKQLDKVIVLATGDAAGEIDRLIEEWEKARDETALEEES